MIARAIITRAARTHRAGSCIFALRCALAELVADDCVIENTQPAPDGERYEGKEACVALWMQIATTPGIHFKPESILARGDRGEIKWRLVWGPEPMDSVRGVNLMRVRDGRIVEAQGYVKGK